MSGERPVFAITFLTLMVLFIITVFSVLQLVQTIFCALKESKHQFYTPEGFWEAFKYWGEPVNLREQHDSLEFFSALLDNLVEGTKALKQPPFISNILEGCFADQKICKGCPHRYTRIEPFLLISVDVRNHETLMDSLDEFVKGDLLEGNNAYHCERCDKKVDTVKRLCFQKLPDVLAIQLKRFGYDWERECSVKYNDYFEFPDTLSMERYTVDFLSRIEETSVHEMIESGDRQDAPTPSGNSNYRLVGVVVHSGQASGGHYYSYIKQRVDDGSGQVEKWYKFDDVDVSECNIDQEGQMAKLCFGGDSTDIDSPDRKPRTQKRWWNAYILFYERQEYAGQCNPDVLKQESTLGAKIRNSDLKYDPPAALVQKVRQDNLNFFHQRSLYSGEFAQFIKHVTLPNVKLQHTPDKQPLTANYGTAEQIALDCLDLLASYLFQTGFLCKKAVRGRIEEWQDLLLNLLQSNDVCRRWFAANYLFDTPNRFYQYLLECPMADVRSSFAFIIVTLAKLSVPDPPLSLSELNAWTADGFTYGMDCMGPLSIHIISGCYALLNTPRVDYNRNMQQLFHVFYCHMQGGLRERGQLLKLGVHKKFMTILLEEGSNMRAQWNDTAAIHNVTAALICSINLNDIRQNQTGIVPDVACPLNNTQILCRALDNETKQLLTSDNYCYLRKLLEEPTVMELDDTVNLLKHLCWENARASKVVLMELLYYISSIHSADMKPYLVFLLHVLLIKDSWQRKRIQLVIKGGPERDTLLDIILRSKSCHQKRAYLCMKCLTNLLNANSLAAEIFFDDHDNKFRWEGAVKWLGDQLERRPGYHDEDTPDWGSKMSNETGIEYYIERTSSAINLHQKAEALLPEESDEESGDENEPNNTSSQNISSPNTSIDSQNVSTTSQETSVNSQNTSSNPQSNSSNPQNNSPNPHNATKANLNLKTSSINSPDCSINTQNLSLLSPISSIKSPNLNIKSPNSSIKSPNSSIKSPESSINSSINSSMSTEQDTSVTSQCSGSSSTASSDNSVASVQDSSRSVDS